MEKTKLYNTYHGRKFSIYFLNWDFVMPRDRLRHISIQSSSSLCFSRLLFIFLVLNTSLTLLRLVFCFVMKF